MSVTISPPMFLQFFDPNNTGAPLAGGKLFTYQAGTSVKQATWTDSTQVTQNNNPIILDSNGAANVWLDPTLVYKFVLSPANDSDPPVSPLRSVDNISGLVTTSVLTQAFIGAILYPRTAAEIAASVVPTAFVWPEGDIRRYGALVASSDNSTAINAALLVSSNAGNAAFVPPGLWKVTSAIACVGASSMYGMGQLSQIAPQSCDGLTFTNQGTFIGARFFRDFQIIGQGTTLSNNKAIVALMTAASGNQINGVLFKNLAVTNFLYATYGYGFNRCTWENCYYFNNQNGFNFIEQSIKVSLKACMVIRSPVATRGDLTFALQCDQLGGVRPQDVTAEGCFFYGHDTQILATNVLYFALDNCDIDQSQTAGVSLTTVNGGCRVRNCWIDTNFAGVTNGILVNALGAANYDKIDIDGNHITCTVANAGSTGVTVGGNQLNVTVNNNGIGTGSGLWSTGVSITGSNCICKFNGIGVSAGGNAVSVNSSASNVEVGPNAIQPGTAQAATMTNASANIGVTSSAAFPVNSPVQFSATANGFIAGITYYVLTSAANVITVGPAVGQPSIAATGNTAVNVFALPDPVTFTVLTPPGFALHARGSFYMGLTGFAANQFGQCNWEATGKAVTLSVPASGIPPSNQTSTTTTMTGLNLPPYLWPVTAQTALFNVLDNTTGSFGTGSISASTGVITFKKDANGSAFTAAGIKAVNTLNSTYGYA